LGAAVKILLGLLMIVVGFGLFIDSIGSVWNSMTGIRWWSNFMVVLTGVIPPLLILIGVFIVWLEADEIGAGKEIKAEEKKEVAAEEKPAEHRKPRKKR